MGASIALTTPLTDAVIDGLKVGDHVIGSTTYGAFCEKVKMAASRAIPIPKTLPFDTAAAFILTYGTSYHALKDRAELKAGETLLVLGAAGGVGLAAVEIGKAMGARVIAAASTPEKLAVCREHGADLTINYSTEDLRERLNIETGPLRGVILAHAFSRTDLIQR